MSVREKTTVRLRATGEGVSHARMDVAVRDLIVPVDEPAARGGTNTGAAPTEMALAALAGCTNVIGHKCAAALGIDPGTLRVEIEAEFDRRGVTLTEEIDRPFVAIRQRVSCDGPAEAEALARLGAEVARFCPLSKLFEAAGCPVHTNWIKA